MIKSGMDALGCKVPNSRIEKTYKNMVQTYPNIHKTILREIVDKCAEIIHRDEPSRIINPNDENIAKIDATGRYRIMSDLLTD